MDTTSIPTALTGGERAITDIESPAPCGCAAPADERARCPVGERLWFELLDARDAVAADSRKRPGKHRAGRQSRREAFAAAREAYWAHVRGRAS